MAITQISRAGRRHGSLRRRLLLSFSALVIVIGGATLVAVERSLAEDQIASLQDQMIKQGQAAARWVAVAGHPERVAHQLSAMTGARVTIVGADGSVQGDSLEPATVGRPIGDAPEVSVARAGEVGHAIRQLRGDEPPLYLVTVPADLGRVVRLSVPLDDVIVARARMRYRLLVAGGLGLVGSLALSWIFIWAVTRPLQAMEKLTHPMDAISLYPRRSSTRRIRLR